LTLAISVAVWWPQYALCQDPGAVQSDSSSRNTKQNLSQDIGKTQIEKASEEVATYQLRGLVLERGTRKPLAGVNVFILPEGLKATTNARGEFSYQGLKSLEGEWIVNRAGYRRIKRRFDFAKAPQDLVLYLEKNSYFEFETTVTAKSKKKDPAKTTLSQEEFLKAPGSGGDPIRALENLPGVLQSFDANVAIQGSPPEDTRYLVEGHEIPFVFHFFGLNTVAVPETVESIDFLAAGYAADYGRASSGIINLELREPRTDDQHAMSYVDFTALGGFYEGPLVDDKSQSLFVGGRYSYIGEVLKAGAEAFGDEDNPAPTFNTAPTYWDINLTYVKKWGEKSKFSLIGISSQDKVEAVTEDADNPTFSGTIFGTTEFYRLIPKFDYNLSDRKSFSTSIGAGVDRQVFEPGEQSLVFESTQLTWRSRYSHQVSDRYSYQVGTDFLLSQFKVDSRISQSFFVRGDVNPPFEATELLILRQQKNDLRQGYFWINDYDLLDNKLVFSPQLRVDHYQLHETTAWQPRGGFRYFIDESSSLYLSSGLYVQPEPVLNQLEASGNPDLEPSRSVHYSLRFEKDFRQGSIDGAQFRSSVFYKDLQNLVVDSADVVSRDGESVPERFNNDGKGSSHGLEFLLRYKLGRLNLNLGYTYTVSRRTDPSSGREFPSEQDQTHNLNLTVVKNWEKYVLSTRFRYVSGLPFTPFTGSVYDENSDVYIPIPGSTLSERFSDFWQLDMRLDRKWIYDTWILSAYLDIQNITNRQNETGKIYNFDFSQSDNATGLPILPTFGVKGEF
jgi:hypothetical protein